MKGDKLYKKLVVITLFLLFCSITISTAFGTTNVSRLTENSFLISEEILLPPPQYIDMSFEKSIMRRMSMRNFTNEPVTDQELSTILWAAYGLRDDGEMTVPEINGVHAAVIYVLLEDVYTYNPLNHSLVLYKEGDYRDIVGWQYSAPVQICLCWNTDIADANFGSAELGAIGQNIYFAANAIGLGTVITAQGDPPAIEPVGIPENEHGMGVMPIGHLTVDYNFIYRPFLFSFLPRVCFSNTSLTTVIEERVEVTSWEGNLISRKDLSSLIWASYGYSYFLDKSESNPVKRHHTVPSAHGYYPFRIYLATQHGVYRFIYGLVNVDLWGLPVFSFLFPVRITDKRSEIAQATETFASDAPLNIIIVLDIALTNQWDDLSHENVRWIWYYEAGAAAHNVLLGATSLGLNGNILKINDKEAICSLLWLDSEGFDPMFVVPVG
jgi:nitroreductase